MANMLSNVALPLSRTRLSTSAWPRTIPPRLNTCTVSSNRVRPVSAALSTDAAIALPQLSVSPTPRSKVRTNRREGPRTSTNETLPRAGSSAGRLSHQVPSANSSSSSIVSTKVTRWGFGIATAVKARGLGRPGIGASITCSTTPTSPTSALRVELGPTSVRIVATPGAISGSRATVAELVLSFTCAASSPSRSKPSRAVQRRPLRQVSASDPSEFHIRMPKAWVSSPGTSASRPSPPTGPARSASRRASVVHSGSPSVSMRASISGKSFPEPWHLRKVMRMAAHLGKRRRFGYAARGTPPPSAATCARSRSRIAAKLGRAWIAST